MEKSYWLSRKRASLALAENAASAEARLIHYDLAGRYSVKAHSAELRSVDLVDSLPPPVYASRQKSASKKASDA